jgi:hypothetical protein
MQHNGQVDAIQPVSLMKCSAMAITYTSTEKPQTLLLTPVKCSAMARWMPSSLYALAISAQNQPRT